MILCKNHSLLCVMVKGKPDLNTSLPVRQTASIFKQPVTKVTNHPSNKVKTDPQKAVEQPRQVPLNSPLSCIVHHSTLMCGNQEGCPEQRWDGYGLYACMYVLLGVEWSGVEWS